jgi:hypothetical protein
MLITNGSNLSLRSRLRIINQSLKLSQWRQNGEVAQSPSHAGFLHFATLRFGHGVERQPLEWTIVWNWQVDMLKVRLLSLEERRERVFSADVTSNSFSEKVSFPTCSAPIAKARHEGGLSLGAPVQHSVRSSVAPLK